LITERKGTMKEEYEKQLKESSLAFSAGFLDVLAGLIISSVSSDLVSNPWIIGVLPLVLTVSGSVSGLFAGNLSTMINVGTVRVDRLASGPHLKGLIAAVIALNVFAAMIGGGLSFLVGLASGFTGGILAMNVFILTFPITSYLTMPLTIVIASISYRRGWDPDVMTYPFLSTLADILSCGIYVLSLSFVISADSRAVLIGEISNAGLICVSILLFLVLYDRPVSLRIVREGAASVLFPILVASCTGGVLRSVNEMLAMEKGILVALPALLTMSGDLGSMIGSLLTTRLAIGTIRPEFLDTLSFPLRVPGIFLSYSFSLLLVGSLGGVLSGGSVDVLGPLLKIMSSGLLSSSILTMLALTTAVLTFRKGLNPDNFVIPIESSLCDLITSLSLASVLLTFP